MADSRRTAGLTGPTLVALLAAESPLVQPHPCDLQIPPVVYPSGGLMFVAGLAVVRAHNLWAQDWNVLVTLTGWFLLILGLVRMFAAEQYRRAAAGTGSEILPLLEGMPLVVAAIITYRAYRHPRVQRDPRPHRRPE